MEKVKLSKLLWEEMELEGQSYKYPYSLLLLPHWWERREGCSPVWI